MRYPILPKLNETLADVARREALNHSLLREKILALRNRYCGGDARNYGFADALWLVLYPEDE